MKLDYIDDLVQDCSNSNVLAIELLQSCTKPSTWKPILHQMAITMKKWDQFDIKSLLTTNEDTDLEIKSFSECLMSIMNIIMPVGLHLYIEMASQAHLWHCTLVQTITVMS